MSETAETNRDAGGNTKSPAKEGKKPVKPQDCQYIYWCFTFNNYFTEYITKNEMIETWSEILKHECKWFVFQEEVGESGTPHLQGTLCLNSRKRLSALKKLNEKVSWRPTKCVTAAQEYCSRVSKRTPGGKLVAWGFEIPKPLKLYEPRGWQLEVMDLIKAEADDRWIHWYWEPTGGVGKSALCKFLWAKHNAMVLGGKKADMFHLMAKYPDRRDVIIIDCPRSDQEYICYGAIEKIKDGFVVSGKYEGSVMVYNYPKVIVFANMPPNLPAMSLDKWKVVEIKGVGLGNVPVPVAQPGLEISIEGNIPSGKVPVQSTCHASSPGGSLKPTQKIGPEAVEELLAAFSACS